MSTYVESFLFYCCSVFATGPRLPDGRAVPEQQYINGRVLGLALKIDSDIFFAFPLFLRRDRKVKNFISRFDSIHIQGALHGFEIKQHICKLKYFESADNWLIFFSNLVQFSPLNSENEGL